MYVRELPLTAAQGVTPVLISPSAQTLGSSAVLVSSLPFLARLPVHGALELWLLEVASLLTPVAIMTEFEATAVVAVATPRCPLLPFVGRRQVEHAADSYFAILFFSWASPLSSSCWSVRGTACRTTG